MVLIFMNWHDRVLEQIVLEIRYNDGQLYLDRCGRLLREILKLSPEWIAEEQATPQKASLLSSRNGCLLNFGMNRMSLSLFRSPEHSGLEEKDVEGFFEQADANVELILDRLEVKDIDRVGCRIINSFPMNTSEESEEWIASKNLCQIPQSVSDLFEGRVTAQSFVIVIEASDMSFRLSVSGIERLVPVNTGKRKSSIRVRELSKGQKQELARQVKHAKLDRQNSPYAVLIDVDAFADHPQQVNAPEFSKKAFDKSKTTVQEIVKGLRK